MDVDKWTKIILDSIQDYKDMLKYPTLKEQLIKKFGETSDKYKEIVKGLKGVKFESIYQKRILAFSHIFTEDPFRTLFEMHFIYYF